MKNKLTCLVVVSAMVSMIFSGCKKTGDDKASFTWNYKGVDYTAGYTLARSMEDLGANIIGGLGNSAIAAGSGPRFRIHPLSEGVHIIGDGGFPGGFSDIAGNELQVTGIVTITSVANQRLTASFILEAGPSGDQHTVSGEIKNIPITP